MASCSSMQTNNSARRPSAKGSSGIETISSKAHKTTTDDYLFTCSISADEFELTKSSENPKVYWRPTKRSEVWYPAKYRKNGQ